MADERIDKADVPRQPARPNGDKVEKGFNLVDQSRPPKPKRKPPAPTFDGPPTRPTAEASPPSGDSPPAE